MRAAPSWKGSNLKTASERGGGHGITHRHSLTCTPSPPQSHNSHTRTLPHDTRALATLPPGHPSAPGRWAVDDSEAVGVQAPQAQEVQGRTEQFPQVESGHPHPLRPVPGCVWGWLHPEPLSSSGSTAMAEWWASAGLGKRRNGFAGHLRPAADCRGLMGPWPPWYRAVPRPQDLGDWGGCTRPTRGCT